MNRQGTITFRAAVDPSGQSEACLFLSRRAGLPKARIKDAMNKGAVWLRRKGGKRERLRRATAVLRPGDVIEFFYDADLLAVEPPRATCLIDRRQFSVWHKPAGLLTQGTDWGDHCSLLRQAETAIHPRRDAFPVHRLDREAAGIVVVAHTREAAARLSKLFRGNAVHKTYRAGVLGAMRRPFGVMDDPLDGKPARTRYSVMAYDAATDTSVLSVEIDTGRLHQIRRHLAAAGHPVMGDPRYGKGNRDGSPMRLLACGLSFVCPFSGETIACRIDGACAAGCGEGRDAGIPGPAIPSP